MKHFGTLRRTGPELERLLAAARRSDVVQGMLRRMRQDILPERSLLAAVRLLANALIADGGTVVRDGEDVLGRDEPDAALAIATAAEILAADNAEAVSEGRTEGEKELLVCSLPSRFCKRAGVVLWRKCTSGGWSEDDRLLVEGASGLLALLLEHQEIQREMARHSRTDHLTGLLNRRAFFEELPRHIGRLERERLPGTLMLVDLDCFRTVNERFGMIIGDRALLCAAQAFRIAVRPTDLVARLGADDYALWLNGADQFTAAERAEYLRKTAPERLSESIGAALPRITVSIGIATRPFGSDAEADEVVRQAEMALQQVKRDARGHWRVAQQSET